MRRVKLAIPTRDGGMKDAFADEFGRAKTFTILDIQGKTVSNVEVVLNPATSYQHGAGLIAVKTLTEKNVNTVMVVKIGIGMSTLLEQFNITTIEVKPGIPVLDAINI